MDRQARKFVLDRYTERVRKHGLSPRSLGWRKGRQEVRFTVLSDVGIADGDSVLDLGCGFGDFARFLRHVGLKVSYRGCDISEEVVDLGKKEDESLPLEVRDIEEEPFPDGSFDWVVASGLFEFQSYTDEQKQMEWVRRMLGTMVQTSRKGVAADFLSSYVGYRDETNFHADPQEVMRAAKALTKRVSLRHDYMPYEFCLYIYKDDAINDRNVFSSFDATLDEDLKRAFAVR